jgi:hypothetical protein
MSNFQYENRKLLIVSMHHKERVIAPLFEKHLGVQCFTIDNLNTDLLGTFSGEIERESDALATAKRKCLMGMEMANCDLAVANEGSFGPHPSLFFVPADDELMLFYDKRNQLEITARELSTNTNFNGAEIKTMNELFDFATLVKFPSHALILKKGEFNYTEMVKGIKTMDQLEQTVDLFISKFGSVWIETDMRAMHNPTRMSVIEIATKKLIEKVNSLCPNCKSPGFGITKFIDGLPCNLCSFPTKGVLSSLSECSLCHYVNENKFPLNKTFEDPMYCDRCNP